jgi:hypothetical protein
MIRQIGIGGLASSINDLSSMYVTEHRCIAYLREGCIHRGIILDRQEVENEGNGFKVVQLVASTLPNPLKSHHLYSSVIRVDLILEELEDHFVRETDIVQEIVVVLPEALSGAQSDIGYFPGMESVVVLVGKSLVHESPHIKLNTADELLRRLPTVHRSVSPLVIQTMGGTNVRPRRFSLQMAGLENHLILLKLSDAIRAKLRDRKAATVSLEDFHMGYRQFTNFLILIDIHAARLDVPPGKMIYTPSADNFELDGV